MRLLWESSKLALKSIWSSKLRTALTVLGIVLGVFTITTLLSLAYGLKKDITGQIEDIGNNLIAIVPGKLDPDSPNPTASLGASTITEKDFYTIKEKLPNIRNLSMAMLVTGTIKANNKISNSSLIFASSENVIHSLNVELEKGRFITAEDLDNKSRVVVLGSNAAKVLFGDQDSLGEQIELRGEEFKVIGTLKEQDSGVSLGGPSMNDLVIMPITTGWEITNTKQIFRLMMQAPDSETVGEYKDQVKKLILDNHNGEEDFTVITQDDAIKMVGDILNILTAMIVAVAALSLVIGGLGVMNIMLVSITERTREIGIRKAVGATNAHILIQFLIEALAISLLGGLIGVVLAGIVALVANQYSPITFDFSPFVITVALGFSLLVGVVFGVAPALSASRKDPITAIRSE